MDMTDRGWDREPGAGVCGNRYPLLDRRCFPRVVIDHPVDILHRSGEVIRVKGWDVSPDGIQLRCLPATARLLQAGAAGAAGDSAGDMLVKLAIPLKGRRTRITARARVIYLQDLEDLQVAIGCQFTRLARRSAERLARFIEAAIEPH